MRETPTYVFHIVVLFTAALTVRSGIEVMARMFTLLIITIFSFSTIVILLTIPIYRVELLIPLFPHGFKPVLHGALYGCWISIRRAGLVFNGSSVCKRQEPLDKFMFTSILISGLSLTLVIVCTIMALGPIAGNCTTLNVPEDVEKFNKRVQKVIEQDIKDTLALLQKQKMDVLGIGTRIYRKDPDLWYRLKPDWEERFSHIPFTVEVKANIFNTGANLGEPVAK